MKKEYKRISRFAENTFPDVEAKTHAKKLIEEANELYQEPTDITEVADCMIALIGTASKSGFTLKDIKRAINEKLEIIESVEWIEQEDGTFKSIKTK